MPLLSRAVLLVSAALCGGFFALSGAGFSWAAEPDQFSNGTLVFWFAAGLALATPRFGFLLLFLRATHVFSRSAAAHAPFFSSFPLGFSAASWSIMLVAFFLASASRP